MKIRGSYPQFSAEIESPRTLTEVVASPFRGVDSGHSFAAYLKAHIDIMTGKASGDVLTPVAPDL